MLEPFISVIVTAWNRKRYLPEALHSLESQTLDRSKFEVIVVKNFEDITSDKIIRYNGWRDIAIDEPDQTAFTYVGIQESKGDVITFLEDDDLYVPERLAYVYAAFKAIKGLAWFHNAQQFINAKGMPTKDPPWILQPPFDVLLNSDDPSWLSVIARYPADFNSSSMAVARRVAERLRNFKGKSVDTALTYIAAFSRGIMYHTSRRLTLYRMHSGSTSRPGPLAAYGHTLTMIGLVKAYGGLCESADYRTKPFCAWLIVGSRGYLNSNYILDKGLVPQLPWSFWDELKASWTLAALAVPRLPSSPRISLRFFLTSFKRLLPRRLWSLIDMV